MPHALNLKESGLNVIIGLCTREANPFRWRRSAALQVYPTGEAVRRADVIFVALPDTKQPAVSLKDIAPNLTKGKTLPLFSHGFLHSFPNDRCRQRTWT